MLNLLNISHKARVKPILLMAMMLVTTTIVSATPQKKPLYVQVQKAALRSEPKFWANALTALSYGAELTPIASSTENTSWLKVKFGDIEGYIHSSAVISRKVVLSSSTANPNSKVDPTTVVLAGKGFNKQVENTYASSKGINFAAVDEVEAQKVDSTEFYTFIHEGKLNES